MTVRRYKINEAAKIAGVSVRTLRHYDEIGLLKPGQRSGAGYRLYGEGELLRLQQILIGRELGLPLEEIRKALDDPGFDQRRALEAQRRLLLGRAQSTAAMIRAVDAALSLLDNRHEDNAMTARELFEGFDSSRYETEVKDRWGNSNAYAESTKRTAGYGAAEWQAINAEQAAIYTAAAAAMQAGTPPAEESVMDIAERHRLLIDRWFYACSTGMHCALAQMYEGDTRFAASIDKFGAGLTPFLCAAIRENARRHDARPPFR